MANIIDIWTDDVTKDAIQLFLDWTELGENNLKRTSVLPSFWNGT